MSAASKMLLGSTLFAGAGLYFYKNRYAHASATAMTEKQTPQHSAFRVGSYKDPSNCYAEVPSSTTPADLSLENYPSHRFGKYYLKAALT